MTRENTAAIRELPNGEFDVQDSKGNSLLDGLGGPFRSRGAAEQAARMLNAFDKVEAQIQEINEGLRA